MIFQNILNLLFIVVVKIQYWTGLLVAHKSQEIISVPPFYPCDKTNNLYIPGFQVVPFHLIYFPFSDLTYMTYTWKGIKRISAKHFCYRSGDPEKCRNLCRR